MGTYSGETHETLAANADIPRLVEEMQECLRDARTIKTAPNIDVYRAVWCGRDVVVKWYKHVGPVHSFRYTIKGSRARRAWTNGHRLLEVGVCTPQPLAYFDEHRGPLLWQSWLITEYVDQPTLRSVLYSHDVSEGHKRRLIHQALRLVDRLGSHGISHGDMKHTNILCDAGRIVLTDLDGLESHWLPWLHRQRRGRDIARFLRDLGPIGPIRPTGPVQPTNATKPSEELWVNPAFRHPDLDSALVAGPQAVVERFQAEPVPSGSASRVHRFTLLLNGVPTGVYLKEYFDRSLLDHLKHLLRPSRARRALRASQMLARLGFDVPEIIALGDFTSEPSDVAPHASNSFTVTLEVAGAMPVYRYLARDPSVPPSCSLHERRELARQLGLTIGRMHRAGIVHGDLRPGNILARRADGRWEFFLIDNERTYKPLRLWNRLRLKNLVQINMLPPSASNTDRLRFFQSYLLMNPRVRLHWRPWARRIMAIMRQRFLKKGWRITS